MEYNKLYNILNFIGENRPKYQLKKFDNDLIKIPFENGTRNVEFEKEGVYTYYREDSDNNTYMYLRQTYANNKLNGQRIMYHENGQVLNTVTFVDGIKQGPSKDYFDNGQLMSYVEYKDDRYLGEFRQYYETGELFIKGQYKNGGYVGEHITYYKNGQPKTIIYYDQKGEVKGEVYKFLEDGTPDF